MKRTFDLIVAIVVMVGLLPVIVLLILLIAHKMGRPVLFRQQRPGLNGRPFEMVKFRTMSNAVDSNGRALPDDQRLTRFGQILRASSLDELPELWNVIKGDMSLVGPRPLLMEYLPLYNERQLMRHNVRPGITGWAQVNGRNAISWEEKFEFDCWYVENHSLCLDIKILWKTIESVFRRSGISQDGHVTMEPFRGTDNALSEING